MTQPDWKWCEYIIFHRKIRHWTIADVVERGGLTAPEIYRAENGSRQPTLRIVCGYARAFSKRAHHKDECSGYGEWLVRLAALAEGARMIRRQRRQRISAAKSSCSH
jgi:transcriptional regulator with XRE-family HTH domain